MQRTLFEDHHHSFRDAARRFIAKEIVPHDEQWHAEGKVSKEMFRKAGEQGLLGFEVDERYGGTGMCDFRLNAIVDEELQMAGVCSSGFCITLHNDICMPYFTELTNDEQKERWLPKLVSGEAMAALAMTEPGTGSDLASIRTTAQRDGDHYVVNGSKTFITNGINSDLVVVAVKTDPSERHKGMSLLVLEEGMEGFERGRNLEKIGLKSQDTAELFFKDVRVPVSNRLGNEGEGFLNLVRNLPRERLSIAVVAVAHARYSFELGLQYARERQAFGQPIGKFQHNRFLLAELKTEVELGQAFVDRQIEALNQGTLTAEDAAMSKYWCAELQNRVADRCLQLHGGYGYMAEYPISRAFLDARIQTIYGGTSEIMKEIVGRGLGL
ncbi:MAG: acyl-CoA dehydrogenase [Acidobacteria bacterium]|nr:MAG: acyl-CoA dehydrogenase [Acidobacteriota bacterium]REK08520.1 MAG: acyl-CoA dehydrogenase [Acidobacteriota bacterium]